MDAARSQREPRRAGLGLVKDNGPFLSVEIPVPPPARGDEAPLVQLGTLTRPVERLRGATPPPCQRGPLTRLDAEQQRQGQRDDGDDEEGDELHGLEGTA